jgi:hypothetical protein
VKRLANKANAKAATQPAKVASAPSSPASTLTPASVQNRSAVLASKPRTAVVNPAVASVSAQPKGIQAKYGLNAKQAARFAALRQTNSGLAAQVRAKLAGGQNFHQAYGGTVAGNTGNNLRGAVQRNLGSTASMRNPVSNVRRPTAAQRQLFRSVPPGAPRQAARRAAGFGGHGRR